MNARPGVAPRFGAIRAVDAVTASAVRSMARHADCALFRSRLRWFAISSRHFAVMMALTISATTQASPCDDFKAVLAARIESTGVRGYSLEVVPADDPVPRDAKVIATCESGTRKYLYRRWGAARAASAAQRPTMADTPTRRAPINREERASIASLAATPAVVAPPVSRASEAAAALAAAPIQPTAISVKEVAAGLPSGRTVVVPPALAKSESPAAAATTLTQRISGFVATQWRWLAALAVVVLLGGLWMWRVPFGAYDKDGLPRGPKL
jgi:hypothetical protein